VIKVRQLQLIELTSNLSEAWNFPLEKSQLRLKFSKNKIK
jgi:hypothetical protein